MDSNLSKHRLYQLGDTPSLRLGAGRSQVQILSPRLSCGWMLASAGGVYGTRNLASVLGYGWFKIATAQSRRGYRFSGRPPTNRPRVPAKQIKCTSVCAVWQYVLTVLQN
jgi:hypothetical protein